jgi:rod shape-determining protein MreD
MQWVKYILWIFGLVLLQGLILNNVLFFGYLNPYFYLIFILFIPFDTDRAALLLLAFFIGLGIDLFENSGGLHAAATTFIAFNRSLILRLVSGKRGREFNELRMRDLTFASIALYMFIMIFVHHFCLFALEAFRFSEITVVILRTLYSSLFTFVLVMLVRFWTFRSQ